MADEKISVLTLIDAIAGGDYGVVIDDPLGTPITKRYTFSQLATYINTALSLGDMSQQSTANYYNKTDADEAARDVVGSALTDGTGIDIVVDDGANTITVSVNATEEAERIRDVIGTALVAGTNIVITVNDALDTITIGFSGDLPFSSFVQAPSAGFVGATGAGDYQHRTPTQVTAALDVFSGDSGSGGVKGMVPAPASGDAAAGRYLSASGSWTTPPGASALSIGRAIGIANVNYF